MEHYIDKIENKIFHGINLQYYKNQINDLDIFEHILKTQMIMTRDDLFKMKYMYFSSLPKIYEQKENEICCAIHPKNEKFRYIYDFNEDYSEAFFHYIRSYLSFIFMDSILEGREYTFQCDAAGELRINGSINIRTSLVAVGCLDRTKEDLDRCKSVRILLNKYEIYVPIVDSLTGRILDDNCVRNKSKYKSLKFNS